MSTKMNREVKCLGCGYTQKDNVSYYRHRKTWDSVHTLAYCKTRKAHPVNQNLDSVDKVVIRFGDDLKMSVVRDSVDL